MADKPRKQNKAVSPVNGVPTPRGKPFTPETAREARQKRTEKEREEKSIVEAFKRALAEEYMDKSGKTRTGAEMIAASIIKGAVNGNAKIIEIALALIGELPPPPDSW